MRRPSISHDLASAYASGLGVALLSGVLLGWLRYWLGFFPLGHGAFAALVTAGVWSRYWRRHPSPLDSPRVLPGLLFALVTMSGVLCGQAIGFGLAMPWYEPLGWLSRVLNGDTREYVFGLAASGGVARNLSLGASGALWVMLNLLDSALLFFLLLILPRDFTRKPRSAST